MNATMFSLLAVTVGFTALVLWVYWPSHKSRLEELGRIPFEHDSDNNNGETRGESDE